MCIIRDLGGKMSILKYFKPVLRRRKTALPDPSGPLSERVPSLSIEAANKKVSKLIANPLESLSEQEVHPIVSRNKTKTISYLGSSTNVRNW